MLLSICAFGLVLFLAACGGGSSPPTTMRPAEPPTPPRDIRAEISAVHAEADTILASGVPIRFQGNYLLGSTTCSGRRCQSYEPVTGPVWSGTCHSLSARLPATAKRVSTAASLSSSSLIVGSGTTPLSMCRIEAHGSATWYEAMIGGTDINNRPEALQGDATVQYDVARSVVSVSFTNVRNIDARQQFHNMGWSEVPVSSDGSFGCSGASAKIDGAFYGPNHAEVGGVSIEPTAVGSFGAKR